MRLSQVRRGDCAHAAAPYGDVKCVGVEDWQTGENAVPVAVNVPCLLLTKLPRSVKVVRIGCVLCASAALIVIGPENENRLLALIVSVCGKRTAS